MLQQQACWGHINIMDTIRDKEKLDEMWAMGNAPWQV